MMQVPEMFRDISCIGSCVNGNVDHYSNELCGSFHVQLCDRDLLKNFTVFFIAFDQTVFSILKLSSYTKNDLLMNS